MKTESRCTFNPKMKCRGAYFSYRRGMEIISCWQDNDFFMQDIEWYLTGRGFDDIKVQHARDYEFEALRKAKIWGYFGDSFDGMANMLECIEPWLRHGHVTPRICQTMRDAEKRFLEVRIKEIIEIGERILNQ